MITTEDQEQLFQLVSKYMKRNITCYAIGGTAMMFYGYKNATKDIDLVFHSREDRDSFASAITELGYKAVALKSVYDEKRGDMESKPRIYSRGEERFDLFVHDVFGFELPRKLEITQRHDFPEHLTINILPIEYLVILKAVTGRATDYEDIVTILKVEKNLDWDTIVSLAIQQKENNPWILVDLEETLQKLKEITFIPKKHFERIYDEQPDS